MATSDHPHTVTTAEAIDLANYTGRGIGPARSFERMDDIMQPLLQGLIHPDDLHTEHDVIRDWENAFKARDPILVLTKERAVGIGARALLAADYQDTDMAIHPSVEPLRAFKQSLVIGGMGKSLTKALIGRAFADEAETRLNNQTSFAAHNNALEIIEIANQLELFGWRDKFFISVALAEHHWRHRLRRSPSSREKIGKLIQRIAYWPAPV